MVRNPDMIFNYLFRKGNAVNCRQIRWFVMNKKQVYNVRCQINSAEKSAEKDCMSITTVRQMGQLHHQNKQETMQLS